MLMILEVEGILILEHIPVILLVGMLVQIEVELHMNIVQLHKTVIVNNKPY